MDSSEGTIDTKLHDAVRVGDIEEVQTALRHGYDPNLIGVYGWSPLHEAAHNGETEILKLLLGKKGDPNKADNIQSRTAMHYAAEQGHVECLRILIDAGGRYDIKDEDGKDCIDLVAPGGRKMLERLKVRDLMKVPTQDAKNTVLEDTQNSSVDQSNNASHDHQSHDLPNSQSLSRQSSQDSAFGDRKPVLGYLTVSVEYHSNKGTLKIRVWQLSDLLLPPPHTSMIYTIYVKSYLHPDKKRDSKRKTEEVKVEASEGHMHLKKHKDKLSVQHVFTPVSFKFNKALEYSGITADVIKDKQLQIDVCITQRYSHRSFMIGMLLLPLKTAVKKVVKEKFALIPCMNHTIPTNMRVYSASEMHITSNAAGIFYSNPNVRVTIPEDIDDNSEKAVSNPDLKHEYSSSTEVDMTEESRIFQKLDFSNMTLDESGYSSEHQVPCPGELESPGSEIGKNIVQEIQAFTTIDMGAKKAGSVKKLFQSAKQTMSPSDKNIRKLSTCEVIEIEFGDSESETPRETKGGMGQDHTGEKGSGNKSGDSSSSRPDTLSWDYYDIPIDSPSVIVENPPHRKEAAPVLLPMETSLEVRQKKSKTNLFGIKKEKEKSKRKSKKTEAPIPGRAIPLVPQIVVVSPDEKLVIDSTKIEVPDKTHTESKESHIPETKVTIKDTTETLAVKTETADSVLKEVTVVKRVPGKLKKAKFVIPKMDKSDKTEMPKEQLGAQPHAPPRLKKKRSKEIAGSEKALQMPVKQTNLDFGDLNRNTKAGTGASSAPVFPSFLENQTFHRSDSNNSAISRSLSATSNSSVIVDVDKLSFASSDSHIVELDQDICITELPSDSELFSDLYSTSSEIKSSRPKDVEKGFDEFTADSERFSPTKQVMPMQVFVEESLDSSDEASSHSFTKGLPTTEL